MRSTVVSYIKLLSLWKELIMKTDVLFYSIFRQFPQLFFGLIRREIEYAWIYKFETHELKESWK